MIDNPKIFIQLRNARTIVDERGSLSVFESDEIGFRIERVYYLYNVPEHEIRGAHAHKELRQLIFCANGAVRIDIHDGWTKTSYRLDDPSKALRLVPGMWRELHFEEPGSVVIVLASHKYDPDDYIHNFEEFLVWSRTKGPGQQVEKEKK